MIVGHSLILIVYGELVSIWFLRGCGSTWVHACWNLPQHFFRISSVLGLCTTDYCCTLLMAQTWVYCNYVPLTCWSNRYFLEVIVDQRITSNSFEICSVLVIVTTPMHIMFHAITVNLTPCTSDSVLDS